MKDKNKTKKELMSELDELRLQLKHFERSGEGGMNIPDETFRLIVESVPNGIVMTDSIGQIIFLNSQAEEMFGYERGALLGRSVEELMPEGFRQGHVKYRSNYVRYPMTRPMGEGRELYAIRADGSQFPVEIGLNFVKSDSGLLVISTIIDITERKYAESRLQEERERAQNYLDIADVILLAINRNGEVTLINKKGCELLGCCEEEIVGKNWFDNFLPYRTRDKIRDVFQKIISEKPKKLEFHENVVISKSGKLKTILWHNTALTDNDGNIVGTLSSGVDITERKETERLLLNREESLKEIMENTSDAIIAFDETGVIETMNREARELFCSQSQGDLANIWEIIPPENKEGFGDKLLRAKEVMRITDYEMEKIKSNGMRIKASISLSYINRDNKRFIETIRDISERVAIRNKIIELEKSQIIGMMAEGFAHHMGTPLASMLLRVQMLKEDIPDLPERENVVEKLNSIERQILYGQKVIQRLLKFVGRPENEKSIEKISTLFDEAIETIRPMLKKNGIELDLQIDDSLKVLADINLMHLVFSDTMVNAIDAMPQGGILSVSASNDGSSDFAEIKIIDRGEGISKETIPFVFEPFFTTKPAGKGTGLGLSVAKGIINEHSGEMAIESKHGEGTTVIIKLPRYMEECLS